MSGISLNINGHALEFASIGEAMKEPVRLYAHLEATERRSELELLEQRVSLGHWLLQIKAWYMQRHASDREFNAMMRLYGIHEKKVSACIRLADWDLRGRPHLSQAGTDSGVFRSNGSDKPRNVGSLRQAEIAAGIRSAPKPAVALGVIDPDLDDFSDAVLGDGKGSTNDADHDDDDFGEDEYRDEYADEDDFEDDDDDEVDTLSAPISVGLDGDPAVLSTVISQLRVEDGAESISAVAASPAHTITPLISSVPARGASEQMTFGPLYEAAISHNRRIADILARRAHQLDPELLTRYVDLCGEIERQAA